MAEAETCCDCLGVLHQFYPPVLQSFQLQMNLKSKQFEWNDSKTLANVWLQHIYCHY